jgi:hypothetical protein
VKPTVSPFPLRHKRAINFMIFKKGIPRLILLRLQSRDTLSLRDRAKKHIPVFFTLQAKPNLGALVKAHEIGS